MKGVTRIEGLGLAPDFPFRLLPASESPIWRQRLASRRSAVATEHGPPLADFGNLGFGSRSGLTGLGRQARQRARKLLRADTRPF